MMYPPCNSWYHVLHIIPATTSGAYLSLSKMELHSQVSSFLLIPCLFADGIWNFKWNSIVIKHFDDDSCTSCTKVNLLVLATCASLPWQRFEFGVKVLWKMTKKQEEVIARLKTGRLENSRGSSSKSWLDYSKQQKDLAKSIQSALSFCQDEGFKALFSWGWKCRYWKSRAPSATPCFHCPSHPTVPWDEMDGLE